MFVLPSLGRPESVSRFIEAYRETLAAAPVVVWVGADDSRLRDYQRLDYPVGMTLHVDKPMRVGEVMQSFFKRWPDEPMYGYLADDVVPRSPHWDRAIERECGDWGFVIVNEGIPVAERGDPASKGVQHFQQKRWRRQPDDLINSNFPMVGGELVRTLGGFMAADIHHFETDVFWQRVAVTLNVHRYRADILLEHMHHALGKSEMDDVYLKYQTESPEYRGWRKDLFAHLAWWTDTDNLKKLDDIKQYLSGKGLAPPGSFAYLPLEQLRRMHLADLKATMPTLDEDNCQAASRRKHDDDWLKSYPALSEGYILDVNSGSFALVHNDSDTRVDVDRPSAMVLSLCEGDLSVAEISETLETFYQDDNARQVREDVLGLIDQLYIYCVLELGRAPLGNTRPRDESRGSTAHDNESGSQYTALRITAHRVTEQAYVEIKTGTPQRDWMNESAERFAYRCLPLSIANQTGWDIGCPASFSALWTGGKSTSAVRIEFYDESSAAVLSHFGEGVLTFAVGYLFRTSPGNNMWVRGPVNSPKDGIAPLEGIVETDWLPFTFTMNWKFTRHHHPVHFNKGEPICRIVPFPRGYISRFDTVIRDLEDDPELKAEYDAWRSSRDEFSKKLRQKNPAAVSQGWQRDYTLGRNKAGKPFEFHETRIKVAPFLPEA